MKQMFFNVASLALVCGLAFIHPVTAAGFNIQVVFTSAVSAAANASFQAAAARWQQVITQTSKTRIIIKKGKQVCGQPPAAKDTVVNDLLIFASIVPIDGVGKILGQAGPCGQDGAGINRLGNMQFDSADADALIQAGMFNSVVLHEMGHVLGIGSNWAQKKLVAKQGNTVIYTGKNGIKGQAEIGGTNNPVVEDQGGAGTALVHWKESVYNNELMTGFLNGQTQPLSALTAESLKDLGFAGVNVGAADAFTEPGVPTAAPTVAATNAGNGAFKINLVFTSTLTPSQTAAFVNAANRWQSIITAPIGNVVQVPAGTQICGQTLANDLTIKDITIFAAIAPIDGVGKILGQAGPCGFDNNGRVRLGNMQFDVADTNNLEAQGTLTATILHEMGHVLGIGTQWDQNNLISPGNPPLLYQGANGNKGQQEIGGTGQAVVEDIGGAGTARGHWKEAVYDNELMTGFLNGNSQPLSKLTIESLKDLGYQVDVNQADAFTIPTQVGRRLRNLKDKAERAKFMEEMTEKDRDLATQVQWEMPYPVESITWNMPTSDDLLSGNWETGYNGTIATTEDQLVEENKDDNVAALVGGVVGTLAVVGAAAAFVVIRRRRSSKTGMASPLASAGAPAFATHGTQAKFNNNNNMQMSAANPAFGQQMPPFAAYAQPQQPAQFYQPQMGGGYNKQQVGGYQYA